MRPLLTLAVLAAIVLEIVLLAQVGAAIGALPTFLLVIGTGILGGALMRREGRRAWDELRRAAQEQRTPERALIDTALVLLGGVLLVVPGFLSDLVGLLLILPVTRPLARRASHWMLQRRPSGVPGPIWSPQGDAGPPGPGSGSGTGKDGMVIQGEVVEQSDTGGDTDDAAGNTPGSSVDYGR